MKKIFVISVLFGLLFLTACTLQIQAPPGSSASSAAESTADSAPTPDATNGLGDAYFPLEGNPGYDAQHYTIELAVDPVDLRHITGTTTIKAVAKNALPNFNLDFLGLNISTVTVDGAPATFSRKGQELTVTPATPITANALFSVSVAYVGTPITYTDPALILYAPPLVPITVTTGWREWSKGYIAAMSQPDGGMTWFPSNNHPADKATYTFRITVAQPKMALASGILQQVIPVNDHTNTYVWAMDDPMSTQVATVIIGEFALKESKAPNGVPIRNYFPPGLEQKIMDSYDVTGDMMDFLAKIYGPYPFAAYGVAVVPGWIPESGYETQALTTLSETPTSAHIIVHELAHQWFGDALTVAAWKDLWLQEGFAQYTEALWAEKTEGVAAYDAVIKEQANHQMLYGALLPKSLGRPALPKFHVFPAVDPGLAYNYFSAYSAGALALHGLRMEVGDETFFKILPKFVQKYKNVPITTKDFIGVAEEVAGRALSNVWNTWLYSDTLPAEIRLLAGKTITPEEIIEEAKQAQGK